MISQRDSPQFSLVKMSLWPKEKCKNGDLIGTEETEDDEVEGEEEMVPSHVIVAGSHVTFWMFEGGGRKLKGRDFAPRTQAVFQKTVYPQILNPRPSTSPISATTEFCIFIDLGLTGQQLQKDV